MIACSLNPTDLAQRREEMRAVPLLGARAELRFGRESRTELERIVAAEARCCSFLAMELRDDGEELVLTVDAPKGAEAVLGGMVEAFAG